MKLLVLSDLHLEAGVPFELEPDLGFDVCVLAGDLHVTGRGAVAWAQRISDLSGRPVVAVAGNHEFYGATDLDSELEAMTRQAVGSRVHVLNRSSVILDGVRFLGCTLWTDFLLPIETDGRLEVNVEQALQTANALMPDYQAIQVLAPAVKALRHRQFARLFRAEDALARHWIDRDWLRRALLEPFDGPTVVVTHHAPSARSIAPRHVGDRLSPAFSSDLPDEFFHVPTLWVHGHTHVSVDYLQGKCRVISNPRGYVRADGGFENDAFAPGLVVEVEHRVPVSRQPVEALAVSGLSPADTQDEIDRLRSQLLQRARANVLNGTRWITSTDLNDVRASKVDDPLKVIQRWLESRRIFAIEIDGDLAIPFYALDEAGEPIAALAQVIDVLMELGGFRIAAFFESPSTWLNGKRPREVLLSQPQDILKAAQDRLNGALHG